MNGSIKITDKINTVFFIETNNLFGLVLCYYLSNWKQIVATVLCERCVAARCHLVRESLVTPDVCISADEPITQNYCRPRIGCWWAGAPFRSQAPGCCRDDGDRTRVLEFREVTEGLFKPPGLLSFAHYVMTAGSGVLLTRLSIGTSVVDGVMERRWS